jgi:ADP-ribosyl-[dinitrogen reductase] hydrolase
VIDVCVPISDTYAVNKPNFEGNDPMNQSSSAPGSRPDISDRFLGSMLGLAIGDAFGMPAEGLAANEIESRYGWIDRYHPRTDVNGDVVEDAGEITDDTEMMLCHVESLVSTGGLVDPENTGMRFLRLFNSDSRRFMTPTTQQSLTQADETGDFQAGLGGEHAADNGVAMRIAPVGLVHSVGRFNAEVFVREVMRAGLITHSNPEAINGALAMAYGVRLQVTNDVPTSVLADEVCSFIDEDEVCRRLRLAGTLAQSGRTREHHVENLQQIGTSRYVAESVAAAFYCAIVAETDLRTGIELATNAGGDTDTVAAMTGALIGAHAGASSFPLDLVEGLAGRAYILVAGPSLYETAMQRAGLFVRLHQR